MPQMSPISWVLLMLFTVFLILVISCLFYFLTPLLKVKSKSFMGKSASWKW